MKTQLRACADADFISPGVKTRERNPYFVKNECTVGTYMVVGRECFGINFILLR
jgi:hypothetical protein